MQRLKPKRLSASAGVKLGEIISISVYESQHAHGFYDGMGGMMTQKWTSPSLPAR